ncbi:hypothetical protein [Rhodococcus sp. EPR-157]|uniref:hypothetical protein n=1 Tax=Rhodococcus sp. EPR-157 TaxID=1813677 RepID=UPI000AE8B971|nr:hypothetical protein [Rhodococcus sp. EPR-157]
MFAQIDELSDEPVSVTRDGLRIRIRYGSGIALSMDRGEAVALVAALTEAMGGGA